MLTLKTWRDGIAGRWAPRVLMLCASLSLACDRDKPRENATPVKSAARSPSTPKRALACGEWTRERLSAPGSFDLALTSGGALLVWSFVDDQGASVMKAQRLSAEGDPVGPPRALTLSAGSDGTIEEVTAVGAAGTLGLAWVLRRDGGLSAWGTHGPDHASAFMPPELLGVVEESGGPRGRVLVAAGEDGEIQATWRGERAACEAQVGMCSHYSRRSLTRQHAEEGGSIAREIPLPCDRLLVGSLWADGSWYEAVCRSSAEQAAYVFSFRPAISYAEAAEVLAGCSHYGLARATVGAALWAQCPDGVAVATRSHQPEHNQLLRGVTREIACRQGRPMLRAMSGAGVIELPLSAPTDAIGPAVADVSLDARAVWTGSRVLVAEAKDQKLTVIEGRCDGDTFGWSRGLGNASETNALRCDEGTR